MSTLLSEKAGDGRARLQDAAAQRCVVRAGCPLRPGAPCCQPSAAGPLLVSSVSQHTRPCLFSVPVHRVQMVLRGPRPALLGRPGQLPLEVPVPALRGLAASRPLPVEAEDLAGAAAAGGAPCRSRRPLPCFAPPRSGLCERRTWVGLTRRKSLLGSSYFKHACQAASWGRASPSTVTGSLATQTTCPCDYFCHLFITSHLFLGCLPACFGL